MLQQTLCKFYDLPKTHKGNITLRPIVSACGTYTYRPAKFLAKILQQNCQKDFSFVKGNKGLAQSLKEQKVAPDETIEPFDIHALSASIPMPVALEVISRIS